MTPGEIGAMLTNINNIQFKLEAAAGSAVTVEMRMRLIGQLSKAIRDKLSELIAMEHAEKLNENPKAKKK